MTWTPTAKEGTGFGTRLPSVIPLALGRLRLPSGVWGEGPARQAGLPKNGARGRRPKEADPLHKGALLMAAPSGLTRFTTSLCVGPIQAPYRGHLGGQRA